MIHSGRPSSSLLCQASLTRTLPLAIALLSEPRLWTDYLQTSNHFAFGFAFYLSSLAHKSGSANKELEESGRWTAMLDLPVDRHISPKENETTAPYLSWVSGVLNLPKELPCIVFYSHSTYETKPVIHKRLNAPLSVAVPPLKVVGAPHVKQMEQTPRSTSFVAFRIITPFRTCRGSSSNMLMFMPNKRYIFHLQGQICSWATVIAWSCVESEEMRILSILY